MKRTMNIPLHIACIAMILSIAACTKEDDYKKFVNGEERIYRAKPANLQVFPGYLRAAISFELYNPLKVDKYEIYLDDIRIAEGDVSYGDTVRILRQIANLQEKTYQVKVLTVDENDLKSVTTSGFLNVFGDRYIASLNQRTISRAESTEPGLVNFSFSPAEPNVAKSVLRYVSVGGIEKLITINPTTNQATLNDLPETGNITYRTYILPDANSIDTLPTPRVDTIKIQNITKQWFSSEETTGEGANNGRLIFAFDGDLNTFWHTRYSGGTVPYPHWFIQDLGASTTIQSFRLARRNNSATLSTRVRIEVKDLGADWKLVGEYTPNANINGYQVFAAQNLVSGRFVRFTGISGPTAHTCVAEFKVNP